MWHNKFCRVRVGDWFRPGVGVQVFRAGVRVGVWSPKSSNPGVGVGAESHEKNKDSASLLSIAVQPKRSVHAPCKHSHIRQSVHSEAFLNKNYLLTYSCLVSLQWDFADIWVFSCVPNNTVVWVFFNAVVWIYFLCESNFCYLINSGFFTQCSPLLETIRMFDVSWGGEVCLPPYLLHYNIK